MKKGQNENKMKENNFNEKKKNSRVLGINEAICKLNKTQCGSEKWIKIETNKKRSKIKTNVGMRMKVVTLGERERKFQSWTSHNTYIDVYN